MWRDGIAAFARGLSHPAWGLSHCERTYRMTMRLAEAEGMHVREPVVFAVAHLHDAGAFDAYRMDGSPQYEASAVTAEEVLRRVGFPDEYAFVAIDVIRAHDFERPPLPIAESRCFHDADILDFMGAIGVTRLLSIVGLEDWTPDVASAVGVAREFSRTLPAKLVTKAALPIAQERKREMDAYLSSLETETARLAEV